MSENEKSTDPGLSAAERKELRGHEAKEAVADHEAAQQAFHENRQRLREERLARGGRGADAPVLELRHAHRKRPIFYEDQERGNSRGMESRRRNSRGFGCNAVGPAGSCTGLGHLSS